MRFFNSVCVRLNMKRKYDVAAYIWPAYTGDEPRTRMFWSEGIGEWLVGADLIFQFIAFKNRLNSD